jgi:hypothetical protein
MTDSDVILLSVEGVRELLESQDRFLQVLQALVESKLAEERRGHLTLVKEDERG